MPPGLIHALMNLLPPPSMLLFLLSRSAIVWPPLPFLPLLPLTRPPLQLRDISWRAPL
jgi:hypothetical protein